MCLTPAPACLFLPVLVHPWSSDQPGPGQSGVHWYDTGTADAGGGAGGLLLLEQGVLPPAADHDCVQGGGPPPVPHTWSVQTASGTACQQTFPGKVDCRWEFGQTSGSPCVTAPLFSVPCGAGPDNALLLRCPGGGGWEDGVQGALC